ncbi:hypothetical protein JTB14_035140 [Gonioctena quinquepunctata]|nr:hypothetical protein JTB14_035140 [Gonioctena quinquepunctata]
MLPTSKEKQIVKSYLMKKSFQSPDVKLLGIIYKSSIGPLLEYNVVVWSPHFIRDISILKNVKRKPTKWAPQIQQLEYNDITKSANIAWKKKTR